MARYKQYGGVAVRGFSELAAALREVEGGRGNFGISYEMQRGLAEMGEVVAKSAPGFITHKTGRGSGELEGSVKVAVTAKAASVYSTSVYGGVQNVGGYPKAGPAARGPHIRRDAASKWMKKAVDHNEALIEQRAHEVIDRVVDEFERG